MDGLVRLTDKVLIDALFGKVGKNSLNPMIKQCLHFLMDNDDKRYSKSFLKLICVIWLVKDSQCDDILGK